MDDNEIESLGPFNVTRKDDDANDKIYLHFKNDTGPKYIHKKAVICQNTNINTFPYIPPQLYKRFSDLSRFTFIARQQDKRLKTRITLGDKDLELQTKLKDVTDWETEPDLNAFGKISEIDNAIIWPNIEVKMIYSPPKGRTRKNVHNLSRSSSEGDSPLHKKSKIDNETNDKETQENVVKVNDFVKKLEERQNKKQKYKQSTLNFPSNKK